MGRLLPLRPHRCLVLGALLGLAACGESPTAPPTPSVQVTSVQPASGSTFGGTRVTITGSGFGANSAVTFGGVPAASVVVNSNTSLTATTSPVTAGSADVTVTVSGRQGTLRQAFTFITPTVGPNAPPVIFSLAAQGPRAGQPAGMGDLGEVLALTAVVTDSESTIGSLSYTWTATAGSVVGTGPTATLTLPSALPATPLDATVTLTVVESYAEVGPQGLPIPREHRVGRSVPIRIHNASVEIAAMAERFLQRFSVSSIPTADVLADFSPTCDGGRGRADEAYDVDRNRCAFVITSYFVGAASPASFHFGGRCTLITKQQPRADACTLVPVRWVSTTTPHCRTCPDSADMVPGVSTVTQGVDQVTAVYESGRWRLCHSTYEENGVQAFRFKR